MSGTELLELGRKLSALHEGFEEAHLPTLKRISDAATLLDRSWSGSNLGYHADVYYAGLEPRPPGAQFSSEWGIEEHWPIRATVGDWQEYSRDDVISEIYRRAGIADLARLRQDSSELATQIEARKADLLSNLTVALEERDDSFLKGLRGKLDKCVVHGLEFMLRAMIPSGQFMTRDTLALTQGRRAAPHQYVIADMASLHQPSSCAGELSNIAQQAGSHLIRLERRVQKARLIGTNVFIGHGRASAWRIFKDFVKDRLALPYDEFNRVPVAGITNVARLSEMLESSAIAFLILTAEDEQLDGKQHARMNVIHEVGLFQGRLGFTRAIVLLEQGCEEFSNIHGLGQIRFPKDNIAAAFEEVRLVLEREGLLEG